MNPFRLQSQTRAASLVRSRGSDAHAVPWRITRRDADGLVEVVNQGATPLFSARFALAGDGLLGLSLPRTVWPGERLQVVVRGAEAERAVAAPGAMLMLRWFLQDGEEMLWPIALE